ncbi:MAG: asparagine synthase-related protein [Vicinamibacterales bacterium]
MSGIAGLVHLDGAPIDRCVLDRMTAALGFRASRAQVARPSSSVALGYAAWRVDEDADRDEQPRTIDGREWIVADARIDARPELVAALGLSHEVAATASDADLILHAYRFWGDDCILHLLGDFTFAVWDAQTRRLFCARDHLGVKPFYYADRGGTIVFSNALDSVRAHPAVSRDLHEPAIADFLLFGGNQDCATTSFRDIRRLPPASWIAWSAERIHQRRYWTLPVDEPLVFRHASDYTDRFMELLRDAVADRLPAGTLAVLMSGGIDSTALAATAVQLLRRRGIGGTVHAMTSVYDRLIPDDEGPYARLVADHLGIPIHFDVRDDEISIADWDRVTVRTPEPVDNPPAFAAALGFLNRMSAHARVFFYGEGPDNALRYEWRAYLSYVIGRGRLGSLIRAIAGDLRMHPRILFWSSIRGIAGARHEQHQWRRTFPSWLNEDFALKTDARARWDTFERPASSAHPLRPQGYASFAAARWQPLFEDCDRQGAIAGVEFRHPFVDVRLLQYMLALPSVPWCRNKLVLRRAMRGVLPDAVLRRKKTPVRASADLVRIDMGGFPRPARASGLEKYVKIEHLPTRPATVVELRAALRPLGLNYWLQNASGH